MQEGNLEKSIQLFEKSTSFWKKTGNLDRVFTNNLLGIELFGKNNQNDMVQKLIKENQGLISKVKLNQFLQTKFDSLTQLYIE